MPENVFPIDQDESVFDQEVPGHNRWPPETSPAAPVGAQASAN